MHVEKSSGKFHSGTVLLTPAHPAAADLNFGFSPQCGLGMVQSVFQPPNFAAAVRRQARRENKRKKHEKGDERKLWSST
jgi:hypothetical protein